MARPDGPEPQLTCGLRGGAARAAPGAAREISRGVRVRLACEQLVLPRDVAGACGGGGEPDAGLEPGTPGSRPGPGPAPNRCASGDAAGRFARALGAARQDGSQPRRASLPSPSSSRGPREALIPRSSIGGRTSWKLPSCAPALQCFLRTAWGRPPGIPGPLASCPRDCAYQPLLLQPRGYERAWEAAQGCLVHRQRRWGRRAGLPPPPPAERLPTC